MKNKTIVFFLTGMALIIVGIIAYDFVSTHPDRQPANPYTLETDKLKNVNDNQIIYREIRNLILNFEQPTGISYSSGTLVVVGDRKLIAIDRQGQLLKEIPLEIKPLCVKATPEKYYVGSYGQVIVLDSAGTFLTSFGNMADNSIITSVDVSEDKILIADAGKRMVCRYNTTGEKELEFEGKDAEGTGHGFIVPSPNFDLAFNRFGDLWVANPGKHALENYTLNGEIRGYWTASFSDVKGFSGCCNPAHFSFLPDGNFITSEKGIVRIKEYKPSGEFVGVVAPPSAFRDEQHAPDITCDEQGMVYVLDQDKKMIRVFERL